MNPILLIATVMIAAGTFGGLVNFYLAKADDVPTPTRRRSIALGIAASLLVPLFLNMISSDLIERINGGDHLKLLVLLGFCLVGAISSTAFIRTVSDRVLNEAKKAKVAALEATARAAQIEQRIQPILSKETESEGTASSVKGASVSLTNEGKLLLALGAGRWVLRTPSGLAREAAIGSEEVARLLHDLGLRGLVGEQATKSGTRWFITDEGRVELARLEGSP